MKKPILTTFCAGMIAVFAQAADPGPDVLNNWHQWRGPLADGTAPRGDPPVTWSEDSNVKWKAALTGRGSATPVVWGNRVFVVTAVKTDRVAGPGDIPKPDPRFETRTNPPMNFYKFNVLCFDRASGKLLWEKTAAEKVPHEGHHPSHSYAASSPTTDGRFLYVSFGSFGIFCYDFAGNLKWQRDLGRMHTRLGWGEAVTPVVHGNSLLLNYDQEADSALYCLDARTGETKWKKDRDEKTSWNTPLVVEHKGRAQVIVNATKRIRSYDLETGQELWACGGMTTNAIPSAVPANDRIYVMSGYKGAAAVGVSLDATGDVTDTDKVLWRYGKGTPYVPSPLLMDGRLYFTQGNDPLLTILNAATGKPTLEATRLPGVKSFYASPVGAAGRVYLVDRDGTTLVLKGGDKLEVLATNRLDDAIDASPVVVGKQLFLRGEKYLYCIEGK
jgi:outer membrane protein assembly factor BamB